MGRWLTVLATATALLTVGSLVGVPYAQVRTVVTPETRPTTASAVVVEAGAVLAHTGQILPVDAQGKAVGKGRADVQGEALFDRLDELLRRAGSGLEHVVKLNLQAARPEDLWTLEVVLRSGCPPASRRPAVATVIGATLPDADALVSLDAVAVAFPWKAPDRGRPPGPPTPPRGCRPASPCSPRRPGARRRPGRPGQGPGRGHPQDARRAGQDPGVPGFRQRIRSCSLACSVQPMSGADAVQKEVAAYFAPATPPPLVLVEWKSSAAVPIEIELIAASPGHPDVSVEYLTPPELKPSPVFSRVARVGKRDVIYLSELYGPKKAGGREQVEAVFAQLQKILAEAGSDLKNLAKATYYVSDDDASKALNDLRPKYYDPARPPSASKATVPGVGAEGRTLTLDMIAVSTRPSPDERK
ncbi:MAG: Rid family hydrolase [Isosphaeraceae bacterium]